MVNDGWKPVVDNGLAVGAEQRSEAVLRIENLSVGYRHAHQDTKVVATGLNEELRGGELVCLLGPNGAGKSTLMRTIAGLQQALDGAVYLGGDKPQDLAPRELARRLSIVLTARADPGSLLARELVALGRQPYTDWWGTLTPADEKVVAWAIGVVGARALAERPVQELSDGERQKIMIARALAQEPQLILLDEPTAFLDLPRRVEVMGLLRLLARRTGRAVLLSTHDLDLALRSGDRLWLMSSDGQIQSGAPEDLVLSGAFERVFASEGVSFDPYTGSFRIVRDSAGVVQLDGKGMAAQWTVRALEREGFCVDRCDAALPADDAARGMEGSSTIRVEVRTDDEGVCWICRCAGEGHRFTSLYDLAGHLRSR